MQLLLAENSQLSLLIYYSSLPHLFPMSLRLSFANALFNRSSASRAVNATVFEQRRFLKRPPVNTSLLKEGRRTGALCMKVGMISVFDAHAVRRAVTILQLDSCQVVQVKTKELNGYDALQLGVGEAKVKKVKRAAMGHYAKAGVLPKRKLMEFRVSPDCLLPVGATIHAQHFVPGQLVDVCGISKGKGFQGVMKRWGFRGGPASHGNSLSHRIAGSTGCRQDPGRVFKNRKMAGRMGGDRVTVQNLKVMRIDPDRALVYIWGGVPGNNGTFLRITDAVKGPFFPSPPPIPTFVGEVGTGLIDAPLPAADPFAWKEVTNPF